MDIVKFIYKDNVIVSYKTSRTNVALAQKVEILAVLAGRLLNRSLKSRTKVFIKYENDYLLKDSTAFTLGYDEFHYAPEKENYKEWAVDSGIVVMIRDRGFSISQALKLINWAVHNKELVKSSQTSREIFTLGGSTATSIPYFKIAGIVRSNDTLVDAITRDRQDQVDLRGSVSYPKYFYQDDKFHIANADTSERALSDLIHIIHLKHADYLAFVNDSTFFYKGWPEKLQGPFTIKGFKNIGLIEYDCLVADAITSGKRITLNVNFGMGQYATKALFIPSLNNVISRYDTLENYYIDQVVSPKGSSQHKGSARDIQTMVLYGIIIVSVALNAFLFVRSRK